MTGVWSCMPGAGKKLCPPRCAHSLPSGMHLRGAAWRSIAAARLRPRARAQVQCSGRLREQHCLRIMPALLPAAELLLRVLDFSLERGHPMPCGTMRNSLNEARCTATRECMGVLSPGMEAETGFKVVTVRSAAC